MAKWFGKVGFAVTEETVPGVWTNDITERDYYGDVIRISRSLQAANQVNDDINVSNQISIVSDPFANEHFHAIRYVEFMGTNWKVTNIDVQFPRLTLSLGGVWNEH